MNTRAPKLMMIIAVVAIVAVALAGCKKSEPEPASPQGAVQTSAPDAEQASVAAADTIEQKTCPVMGMAINKDIFVDHQGKKVYFCCPACIDKFEAEPEKYIAELPQFNK